MDNYILVQNIRKLCVEKNIKITALEKALGFPQGRINKWTDSTPSIDKVVAVADYFRVSVDSLINEKTESVFIAGNGAQDFSNLRKQTRAILENFPPGTGSPSISYSVVDQKTKSSKLEINRLQNLTIGNFLKWHKIDTYNIQNTDIQKLYDSIMSQNPYLDCFECQFMKGSLLMFQSFDSSNNEEHNEAYLYIQGREDSYPLLIESGSTLIPLVQDIYEQTDTQSVYQSVNHIIESLNNL